MPKPKELAFYAGGHHMITTSLPEPLPRQQDRRDGIPTPDRTV